jgi:hypothetical protein
VLEAIQRGHRTGDQIRRYFDSLGQGRPVFVGLSGPIQFDGAGDVNRDYTLETIGRP